MKVLFLSNMDRFSGGEIVMERLILDSTEFEAAIALPSGLFKERCQQNGIATIEANEFEKLYIEENRFYFISFIKVFILSLYRILRILYKNEFDLIVINNDGIVPAAGVASFLRGKKTVWICYNIYQKEFFKRIYKLSWFVDCITPVSNAVNKSFEEAGVEKNKLKVIYSGLNPSRLNKSLLVKNHWRNKYLFPKNTVIIGIIGVITRWKGHTYLLEALSRLNTNLNWHLLIIGDLIRDTADDKLYLKEIEDDIIAYGLNTKVSFTGRVNLVEEIYSDLDIVVNSSINPEPLGTTIYEGMAFEKVVIATNIGGSPEIIVNGQNGFLVDINDAESFADAMTKAIHSLGSNCFGLNAFETVNKKFNTKLMAKKFTDLFSILLGMA